MFLIVVTSPLLHLYYEDVWIEIIDGSAKLIEEYVPLHPLYLLYILGYFVGMIVVIIHSLKLKKIASHKFSGMLAGGGNHHVYITIESKAGDVLEGILDSKSRKEIAVDLHLSENTVKMHTSSLYKALGVSSRERIFALIK